MKYVCPDAISNITSLRYLEVSFNNLSDINVRHTHLFERLFSTLREIQIISLKSNSLRHIPKNIYFNNNNLRKIDLSFNHISKVTFKIDRLKHLMYLNLRSNMIITLGGSSMMRLDNILDTQIGDFVILNREKSGKTV